MNVPLSPWMDLILVLGFLGILALAAYRGVTVRFKDETDRDD